MIRNKRENLFIEFLNLIDDIYQSMIYSDNNLYYLMSRYYNPNWGRFISYDSVNYLDASVASRLNLYAYCLNNPVMYSDPEGTNAIYVVDYTWKDGLPVVGHARLYYQGPGGEWYYTEYYGKIFEYIFDKTGYIANKYVGSFENVLIQLSSINMLADCYYISGGYIENYEKLNLLFNDKYSKKYSLFKNNCLHYAVDCINYYLYGDDVSKYDTLKTIVPGWYKPKNGVRFDPVVARYIEYALKHNDIVTNGFSLPIGYSRFIFRQN